MKKQLLFYLALIIGLSAQAQQNTVTLESGTSPVTPTFRYKSIIPDSLNHLWINWNGKYNRLFTATETQSLLSNSSYGNVKVFSSPNLFVSKSQITNNTDIDRYGTVLPSDGNHSTLHITGLKPNTTYTYIAKGVNEDPNAGIDERFLRWSFRNSSDVIVGNGYIADFWIENAQYHPDPSNPNQNFWCYTKKYMPITFTTPANCTGIYITANSQKPNSSRDYSDLFFLEGTEYNQYYSQFSRWVGKTVMTIGDSFTDFYQYQTPMRDVLKCNVVSSGVSGSCVTGGTGYVVGDGNYRMPFVRRVKEISRYNPDAIVFEGLFNDRGYGTKIGSPATANDTTTIYGSLTYIFDYVRKNFPGKEMFFVGPSLGQTDTSTYKYWKQVTEMMIERCNRYSVPFLNMADQMNVSYENVGATTIDGLHFTPAKFADMGVAIARMMNNSSAQHVENDDLQAVVSRGASTNIPIRTHQIFARSIPANKGITINPENNEINFVNGNNTGLDIGKIQGVQFNTGGQLHTSNVFMYDNLGLYGLYSDNVLMPKKHTDSLYMRKFTPLYPLVLDTVARTLRVDTTTALDNTRRLVTSDFLRRNLSNLGGGTVTSVTRGLGIQATGTSINTTGTIAVDTTAIKSKASALADYNVLAGRFANYKTLNTFQQFTEDFTMVGNKTASFGGTRLSTVFTFTTAFPAGSVPLYNKGKALFDAPGLLTTMGTVGDLDYVFGMTSNVSRIAVVRSASDPSANGGTFISPTSVAISAGGTANTVTFSSSGIVPGTSIPTFSIGSTGQIQTYSDGTSGLAYTPATATNFTQVLTRNPTGNRFEKVDLTNIINGARTPAPVSANTTMSLNSDYLNTSATQYNLTLPPTTGFSTDGSKIITALVTGTGGLKIVVPSGYSMQAGTAFATTTGTGGATLTQGQKVQLIPIGTNSYYLQALNGSITVY